MLDDERRGVVRDFVFEFGDAGSDSQVERGKEIFSGDVS